ncbi:general secretion pathway protein GspB, partial [Aeromonas australiensis]|nr:general secretion pathway protein GspB [Aeromonas australiensis]
MSTLLKALHRAQQPQLSTHIPAMGLPMPREEERSRRRIGWLLAPLALLLGAGANYGWHLIHLRPIEEKVEVKEVITPPFVRVEPKAMVTRPLPPPPLPEPVVQPRA